MRYFKYATYTLLVLFLAVGCSKEDKLDVDLETFERKYDANSSDPVIKAVSKYFFKYDKQLIIDPVIGDYVYNFDKTHNIEIDQIDQKESNVLAAINFVEDYFLKLFSDDFIDKYFPLNLIVANDIRSDWDDYLEKWLAEPICYVGRYFFTFLVNDEVLAYSDEEKKNYSSTLYSYVLGAMFTDLNLDEKFYEPAGSKYTRMIGIASNEEEVLVYRDKAYSEGFVDITIKPLYEQLWLYYPSKENDLVFFIKFLVSTPEAERIEIFEKYPIVSQKAELVLSALEKHGINPIK